MTEILNNKFPIKKRPNMDCFFNIYQKILEKIIFRKYLLKIND